MIIYTNIINWQIFCRYFSIQNFEKWSSYCGVRLCLNFYYTWLAPLYLTAEHRGHRPPEHLAIFCMSISSWRQGSLQKLINYCLRLPQYFKTHKISAFTSSILYIAISICCYVDMSIYLNLSTCNTVVILLCQGSEATW